jgi:hypothetical protein
VSWPCLTSKRVILLLNLLSQLRPDRESENESRLLFSVMRSSPQTVHSLFTPPELVLEKQWLESRDTFLLKKDITRALELAAACPHPEAQWLTRVCAGKTVNTLEEARDIFLALGENDARGLCFAARCMMIINKRGQEDEDDYSEADALLRRSAELGYAFAQGRMAGEIGGEERVRFATLGASQKERDGFLFLGHCFDEGVGCEENEEKARENYLIAAELGHVDAMVLAGSLVEESDPLRWFWWGRAAKRGDAYAFVQNFAQQLSQLESGSRNGAVVFQIGRALNGHVSVEKRTIFGANKEFDNLIGPANTAIAFYKAQLTACRRSVDAWSLCCLRLDIYKDLRILIGKMIWESRDLALFYTRECNVVSESSWPS